MTQFVQQCHQTDGQTANKRADQCPMSPRARWPTNEISLLRPLVTMKSETEPMGEGFDVVCHQLVGNLMSASVAETNDGFLKGSRC